MNIQDIAVSSVTYDLLFQNGKMDCEDGVNMFTGWQECATGAGFDPFMRTPAREAYEDGYYSTTFNKNKVNP